MRIFRVRAVNSRTKQTETFLFDGAAAGKAFVPCQNICGYLRFCFLGQADAPTYVETEFQVDEGRFVLARLKGAEGATHLSLRSAAEGKIVAKDEEAEQFVQTHCKVDGGLDGLVFADQAGAQSFDGNLAAFSGMAPLLEVKQQASEAVRSVQQQRQTAGQKVRQYVQQSAPQITSQQLAQTQEQLRQVNAQLTEQRLLLQQMEQSHMVMGDISKKLDDARHKFQLLDQHTQQAEEARKKIAQRDAIEQLLPKIRRLQTVAAQLAENQNRQSQLASELEWKEQELSSVVQQLDEKQLQFNTLQEKRTRLDDVNAELAYVASLHEQNTQLNQLLAELEEKKKNFAEQRKACLEKIAASEKSFATAKQAIDSCPPQPLSVSELMENVRVEVKIEEVTTQLEKLQNEIALCESRIAEKESNLVLQRRRFHSVAELDAAVTPLKAKDTILQVLDAKYAKLEAINKSLAEKQRNLQRAAEDYNYKLVQLRQSQGKLEEQRNKALQRKQEEFKREVYVNSQKVYSDDASSVFAVQTNFQDAEIGTLDEELASRNAEHNMLLQRASQLEGAIKEIKRHIEINAAEMDTLRSERENINRRYSEIVSHGNSETAFNYLKALHTDSSTRFLLDVQKDAVRSDAEVAEMKKNADTLRQKVTALRSRLKYLQETQSGLEDAIAAVASTDETIAGGDRLREKLADAGERLALGYDQYAAATKQLETLDSKIASIDAAITEMEKTVKVNSVQIKQATARAQRYSGTEDAQQTAENFHYDLGDLQSEVQMLAESRRTLSDDVFRMRLEEEKLQWLQNTLQQEQKDLSLQVEPQLQNLGLDTTQVLSADYTEDVEKLRKNLARFDSLKTRLSDRIAGYVALLGQSQPQQQQQQQQTVQQLAQQRAQLEELLRNQLQDYLATGSEKIKVTAAAAEARALSALQQTLPNLQIVALLAQDKITSLLAAASTKLSVLLGEQASLEEQDGIVHLVQQQSTPYAQLPLRLQTAVYLALWLTLCGTGGCCIVADDNAAFEGLNQLLQQQQNVHFVVQHLAKNA